MLPSPKKSKIRSRSLAGGKSELERSYYGLSRLVDKNRTVSQTAALSAKLATEKAVEVAGSNKELLSRSLSQQNTNNKILQEIILALKERDYGDDDDPRVDKKRRRTSRGRGRKPSGAAARRPATSKPRIEPTLRMPSPAEPATRTQAPKPTATQQPPRPGRIAVGGGLEYDTATNRFHDPKLPGNRNMVSASEAASRGAVKPSAQQIEEARAARVAARAAPPPAPIPPAPPPPAMLTPQTPELRANPAERLVPPPAPATTPSGPGALQRIDEAAGRALGSRTGRVTVGSISLLAAVPLVMDAYNEIAALPTDMPRSEYEQRVTTIILQLVAAGIALPYIGAVIGGLIGSTIFPGVGTLAGLGAGFAGGYIASMTLDSMVRELVSKIVEHFYDDARRQRVEGEHIRDFNSRVAQHSIPRSRFVFELPDDIEELQRLLMSATVAARSGGTQLRPRARAMIQQINQKIRELREAEENSIRQIEEGAAPQQSSSVMQDSLAMLARNEIEQLPFENIGSSSAFDAMDRSEYRNLTFDASTIVFEGDMGEQAVASNVAAPNAFSSGGGAAGITQVSMPATRMAAPPAVGSESAPPAVGGGAPGPLASSGRTAAPSRFVPGRNEQTSEEFMTELNAVAARLGVQPNDLLAVMRSETGGTLNPSIPNAAGSGAVGLIQFMPRTARGLGTSTEELSRMSQTEQLRYVEAYFRQNRLPRGASAAMIYAYTFMPAAARSNPNQLAVRGSVYYAANQGLDVNDDGIITIDDLDRFLRGERRGRTASGQRVSPTPQVGAEMAGSAAAIEAERMRRQAQRPAIIQQPTPSQQPRRTAELGQGAPGSVDVTLKYRLRQAVA